MPTAVIVAAKALHIAALSLWLAGLAMLPLLFLRYRPNLPEREFVRFRKLTHYGYVRFLSPVAVVAVAAGIVLVLGHGIPGPWLLVKLALVCALACVHAFIGHMIVQTAETGGAVRLPPPWLLLVLVGVLATAIVWVVLAKPAITIDWPAWLTEPQSRPLPLPREVPI